MQANALIWPLLAMVALSFGVLLRLAYLRVSHMRRERIHPQRVATRADTAAMLAPLANISDNLQNLFEAPVLFYLLLVLSMLAGQTSSLMLALAWLYVGLRYLHSWIHCGYNKVVHRFYAFVSSVAVLILMWLLYAITLV